MQAWTVHNFGHYKEQLVLEERDLPQVMGSDNLSNVLFCSRTQSKPEKR